MKTIITINKKNIEFNRNWFTGSFTYTIDGKKKTLASPFNLSTHHSTTLSKTYEAKVGETTVRIVKTRPLLFSAFRPHNYKFFINNELIKEIEER